MALALVALLVAACSAGPDDGPVEPSADASADAHALDATDDEHPDDELSGEQPDRDGRGGDRDEPTTDRRSEDVGPPDGPAEAPSSDDPAPATTPPDPPDDAAGDADTWPDPVRVVAPSIEVVAEVIPLDLRDDGTIEVPPDGADAGWYRHGARPGEPGPTVIGAHVDWSGEPGVFFELGDLVAGDVVTVTDEDGDDVAYRVDRLEQHEKAAFPTFDVYGATPEDTLRLVTCAGPFDRDARSHRDNLVVFATAVA